MLAQSAADIFNQFFTANSLCVVAAVALLVWVMWQTRLRNNERFARLWFASWSSYLMARLLTLVQIGSVGDRMEALPKMLLSGASQAGYYAHTLLLLACIATLLERPWRWLGTRPLAVGVALLGGASFAVSFATEQSTSSLRLLLRVGVRCFLTALAFAFCGVVLLRSARSLGRVGVRLAGVAMLFGAANNLLHGWAFSFTSYFALASYMEAFEIISVCAIGFGLLLWMHEDASETAQAASRELTGRTAELLRAQRLESLGQLAGGLAHDFNNVLTVVIGNTEMLLGRQDLDADVRACLGHTRHAAAHGAKMTRQLLELARNRASAPRTTDVAAEIVEVLPLLRSLVGARIDLRVALPEERLLVSAKGGHIEQILINFLTNGRDAIRGEGQITVSVQAESRAGRACVVLAAADTGMGMSPEVLARIGEPFFTTKVGSGTGMGLASVKSLLAEIGGWFEVESAPEQGTVVRAIWPRVHGTTEIVVGAGKGEPAMGSLLLVEDNEQVRAVAQRALVEAGFEVAVAEDGEAALDVLRARLGEFDLLVTDVLMPRMSGDRLAERVRELRPDLPICFLSGFVDDARSRLPDGLPLLGKPFSMHELVEFVRGVLATAQPSVRR